MLGDDYHFGPFLCGIRSHSEDGKPPRSNRENILHAILLRHRHARGSIGVSRRYRFGDSCLVAVHSGRHAYLQIRQSDRIQSRGRRTELGTRTNEGPYGSQQRFEGRSIRSGKPDSTTQPTFGQRFVRLTIALRTSIEKGRNIYGSFRLSGDEHFRQDKARKSAVPIGHNRKKYIRDRKNRTRIGQLCLQRFECRPLYENFDIPSKDRKQSAISLAKKGDFRNGLSPGRTLPPEFSPLPQK